MKLRLHAAAVLALALLGAAAAPARAGTAVEKPYSDGLERITLDVSLGWESRYFTGPSPFSGEETTFVPAFTLDWTHFLSGALGLGAQFEGSGFVDKDEKLFYMALGFAPKWFFQNESPVVPYVGAFVGPAYGLEQVDKTESDGTTKHDVQSEFSIGLGGAIGFDVPLSTRYGINVEYTILYSPFHEYAVLRNGLLIGFNLFF
jgi:hypothetical protein